MAESFIACNQCKHYRSIWLTKDGPPFIADRDVCTRPTIGVVLSVVTGKHERRTEEAEWEWNHCITERNDAFACGPEARYFEAKENT